MALRYYCGGLVFEDVTNQVLKSDLRMCWHLNVLKCFNLIAY